jgi:hypothetical protein
MSKVVSGMLNGTKGISKENARSEFGTTKAEAFVHARLQRQIQRGNSLNTQSIHCAMSEDLYDYCLSKINRSSLGFLTTFEHGEAYVLKKGLIRKKPK